MIESLFGYDIKYSSRYDEAKSPSPKKHILEPKRLQNITILSKALNVSADHICEALRQGNLSLSVYYEYKDTEDTLNYTVLYTL